MNKVNLKEAKRVRRNNRLAHYYRHLLRSRKRKAPPPIVTKLSFWQRVRRQLQQLTQRA